MPDTTLQTLLGQSPAALLAKIITVHGVGSGLDADLLDGQHGSYYQNAGNLNAGTLLAARMPALTGDVTTTAGAVATTIGNGRVTLAKMANLAANTIIGNNTAASAVPLALSTAQVKTMLGLAKADVGLGNVDNTSDANKPVSSATQTALNLKANLASPALTGTPTAPTATAGTNTTQLATTEYVMTAVSGLGGGSYVDLTTAQRIDGIKTFLQNPMIEKSTYPSVALYATGNAANLKRSNLYVDTGGQLVLNLTNDANDTSMASIRLNRDGTQNYTGGGIYPNASVVAQATGGAKLLTDATGKTFQVHAGDNAVNTPGVAAFTIHDFAGVERVRFPESSSTFVSLNYPGVLVNGNAVWHGGNFDPSGYATTAAPTFSGRITANGATLGNTLRFSGDAEYPNGYGQVSRSSGAGGLAFRGYMHDTFPAYIDFDPIPADGTSAAILRFMRTTNTTGVRQVIFHNGDGTSGKMFEISNLVLQYKGQDIYHTGNFNPATKANVANTLSGYGILDALAWASALPGDDFDLALSPGQFRLSGSTLNRPTGSGSGDIAEILRWNDDNMVQRVSSRSSDRVWIRRKQSGTWQSWYELLTTGSSPTYSGTVISGTTSGELRVGGQGAGNLATSFKFDGTMAAVNSGTVGTYYTIWNSGNFTPSNYGTLASNNVWTGVQEIQGGSKISVQAGVDGGNARGLWMWTVGDSNWVIYMSQAGAGKSTALGAATSALPGASTAGRSAHAIRFRIANGTTQSFIWENSLESCLMSLTSDTGELSVKGGVASHNGALGAQTGHYAMLQGGNRIWHIGIETDRSWKLWAYTDAGAYQNNPVTIHRDAMNLVGGSGGWSIGGGTIYTTANRGGLNTTAFLVSDWNAADGNGWHMSSSNVNAPTSGWNIGMTWTHNPNWITQEVFDFTAGASPRRWRRAKLNGTWSGWTSDQTMGVMNCDRGVSGYDSGVPGSFSCNAWFRSAGDTGWYNASYGVGIWATDGTYVRTYNAGGGMAAPDFVISSDERLKTEIRPLEYRGRLNPVRFEWLKDGRIDFGFIAQQVRELYPEVVGLIKNDDPDNGPEMIYQLSYQKLTAVISYQVNALEDAFEEHQVKLAEAEAKIVELEDKVEALEQANQTMEQRLSELEALVRKLVQQ